MGNVTNITSSTYTIKGTVTNLTSNEKLVDFHVILYNNDYRKKRYLGLGVTDSEGRFSIEFPASKFWSVVNKNPLLCIDVKHAGTSLLRKKKRIAKNSNGEVPPFHLKVDLTNDKLRPLIKSEPAPDWIGGFEATNTDFSYPNPDLTSLMMKKNRTNIDKLKRQQKVLWPEFSWESRPGSVDPQRCYQMFAPDISRLGYDDSGRVYSIICPQQGTYSPNLGSMNVEVTVTGSRGWANETTKELAADMMVEGKIWFGPKMDKKAHLKNIKKIFDRYGFRFPSSKDNAIVIKTHNPGQPDQPIFPLRKGASTDFPIPYFAKHEDVAWSLGHLGVEIGAVEKTGKKIVDDFNQLVVDIFNAAAGNMLKKGNVLTWNVWFTAPEVVDQDEWSKHTDTWRDSIDTDHGSPNGEGTDARHYDGTPFRPIEGISDKELIKIEKFLWKHLIKL